MFKLLKLIFLFPLYSFRSYLNTLKILKNTQNIEHFKMNGIELNKSIIIAFSGGLANQLITYKVGRFLAALMDYKIVFDLSFYNGDKHRSDRPFQLFNYDVKYDLIVHDGFIIDEIKKSNTIYYFDIRELNYLNNSLDGIKKVIRNNDIIFFSFWEALQMRFIATEYLKNKGIISELDLQNKISLGQQSSDFLSLINNTKASVCVHVRRGDYLNRKNIMSCNLEYYNSSIQKMEDQLKNPSFFIFSDDIDWCRKSLISSFDIYFADFNNDTNSHIDMFLASQCKHFILTNLSTFSHQIIDLNKPQENRIIIDSNSKDLILEVN